MVDVFHFPEDQFLLVGKVAKAHGLRGEIKVQPFSDSPETLLQYQRVVLVDSDGDLSPLLKIEKSRLQGKVVIIKLKNTSDRDQAEALQGKGVLLAVKELPPVKEGEYYWYQLYQLPVFTDRREKIGNVESVFSNGAQDIMVIKNGKREYLIPIIDDIVKEYNREEIIITPPPGLLEMNRAPDG